MVTLHLNRVALQRIVESESARDAAHGLAEQVAENVEGQGQIVGDAVADGVTEHVALPVKVYDRHEGGVSVILAHPAGISVQAKHGALTRAASEAGLEVGS